MLPYMEADRRCLLDIEARILDLERSISTLRTEQARVQERLNSYTYPILTLPNEITLEIFLRFLPIYPKSPPLIGLHSPTCLAQVCRQWKELVLTTPELWRAIGLRGKIPYKQRREISAVWIARSGACPLSIDIELPPSYRSLPEMCIEALAHQARWEHLKLNVPLSAFPVFNAPMPLLQSLDLDINSLDSSGGEIEFNGLSLLRRVVATGLAVSKVTLPWGQLTSLSLYADARQCLSVLRQAPNLVHCHLDLWTSGIFDSDQVEQDIALPRLEVLVLDNAYGLSMLGVLNSLVIPALRELELEEDSLGENPISSLQSFIAKSGCRLERMDITRVGGGKGDANSYHLAFPSIPIFLDGVVVS
ncbi:F-box domain-containing protein [Mycena sanguinolenta]|uniref:F-box domain-containing protein n=1 Tax=Mycena sanguinolenta TaxID=230812 RepID=A0A8H6XHJ0_9AGAR|nr:F-box domain-containing protein [Mycena sanguinolenta]